MENVIPRFLIKFIVLTFTPIIYLYFSEYEEKIIQKSF